MEEVYQNLVSRALYVCQYHQSEGPPSKRVIIALSGPPGSGKSTIAATVVSRLNSLANRPFAIALPMDGFHYPKKYLSSLPNHEEAYARRGAHWTFDAAGVLHLVKALHLSKTNERETILAPHFDHAIGDPVEGAISVSPEVSLVILEGNYLAYDVAPWSEIANFVDDTWFVKVEAEVMKGRIAKRHLQSGIERTWEDAIRRAEDNDIPNGVELQANLIQPAMVVQSVDEL
ncbi:P-loop containing nucleoside triphosphate hydrolase protein [Aspergillus cavernicola]|uniref:P-loop containing nucleoside triphosphate hydrolase protein n=1 Tax=Aspergillus cavernicola TaxID=176166 RepID=A0ABR4HSH2_9EURO